MAELGRQAHHRARGERSALAGMDDPLENRAYAVWSAVRTGAVRQHGEAAYGPAEYGCANVAGYEIDLNLTVKMSDLWPELNNLPPSSRQAYLSEIRSFLRGSRNAICVRRPTRSAGEGGLPPRWWIRDVWENSTAVPIFRTMELTDRERRLTATESGEDRQPEPVQVRRTDAGPPTPPKEKTVLTVDKAAGEAPWARLLRDRLLAFARAQTEPFYLVEAQRHVRVNGTDTRRALRALIEEGQLFSRQEEARERPSGASGRYRSLYWPAEPIPPRRTLLGPAESKAMDLVANLRPDQTLPIMWMPTQDRDEIRQMADAGLVEYIEDGRAIRVTPESRAAAKERAAAQRPSTPPTPVPPARRASDQPARPAREESSVAHTAPPAASATPPDLAAALTALVEEQVEARTGGMAHRLEVLSRELSEERQARQRLEQSLIEARTEASEQRQLAERRAQAMKAMLGE